MTEPNHGDALGTSIRESVGGRAASWSVDVASRAWTTSRSRQFVMPVAAGWSQLSRAQQIRTVAIAGVVAMLVDRAMTLVRARPTDPLSAVLPIGVLALCVVVGACAEPLARAAERLGR